MNGMDYIKIFRGDDSDALGYQTIVGTIKTDLDLTGCRAIFRYLGFFQEFDPIPEDGKLTIVIPAQSSRGFPPGVGYASLKVYDPLGKVRTFTNRIPVIVDAMTPVCPCGGNFEVSFSPFPELEPLKIFVGPGADDFDEYTGFLSKIIDRASLEKYGLAILVDAMEEDGGSSGKAASPLAVKAAYDAIIKELTDNYYTAQETDEAIDSLAAYYITSNAAGAAFPTRADLINAQTYYSGGAVRTPTRNDYAVVLADETHDGAEYRYIYAVADGATTGEWQAQYPVGGVMTIDQSVTKNSANPVSSSGIWSAIWGALASLPTGFASLYDWCVAQLAGKASKADATLTDRFSAWSMTPATMPGGDAYPQPELVDLGEGQWQWKIQTTAGLVDENEEPGTKAAKEAKTSLAFQWAEYVTATRTALPGYQLGNDDQHILASEAEAEALRTAVAAKLDKSGGTMTGPLTISGSTGVVVTDGTIATAITKDQIIHVAQTSSSGTTTYINTLPSKNGPLAALSDIPDVSGLANATAIAPEFDASASYAVGDVVMHEGARYKCTTAHSGAWAAADFTAETVQTALENGGGGSAGGIPADAHYVYVNSQGQICYNPDQTGGGGGQYPSGTSLSFAIAPEFSTASTYAVGDVVMYAGLRYVCSTAVSTAGEWTGSTNWTEQTVQDVIGDVESILHTINNGSAS